MGTNCAPVVADLFLFCYERAFIMSLSLMRSKLMLLMLLTLHPDIWTIFQTLIMCILTIWQVEYTIQGSNLIQLIPPDTKAAFSDLHLSISNDIVSTKIYDKRDVFDFEIVNFPFSDADVPRSTSFGVYISHPILFARASNSVADFKVSKGAKYHT